jgi:hypothetical protein
MKHFTLTRFPHLPKKKQKSLRDLYAISEPVEALFIDLHIGENNHRDKAYDEDNLHPSIEEALQSTRASKWKEAMRTEIDVLKKNNIVYFSTYK